MTTPPRPQTPAPPPKPAAQHEPHRETKEERQAERQERREQRDPNRDREAEPFDDPDITTVQEEQLDRSAEIEAMGVEAWKEAHDERNLPDEQKEHHGRAVPGVSPTQKDDPGGKK